MTHWVSLLWVCVSALSLSLSQMPFAFRVSHPELPAKFWKLSQWVIASSLLQLSEWDWVCLFPTLNLSEVRNMPALPRGHLSHVEGSGFDYKKYYFLFVYVCDTENLIGDLDIEI